MMVIIPLNFARYTLPTHRIVKWEVAYTIGGWHQKMLVDVSICLFP